ncbi:hypothetical protein Glove_329g42 [Diversispora epigaea]|uniref:Nucleoporin protein Ndc1-Nup n=1 Tax=Diversispora epigaea TaxID=1348612 RepID=A0A397HKC3_9GLOM|nr:hypothetical protein Glove_329g42 [Diversispora epigaea]
MNSKDNSAYGFACGSTELMKIQKTYLIVTAGFTCVTLVIFQIGISLFQNADSCSRKHNLIYDTIHAFIKLYVIGLLSVMAIRKALIQDSVRRNTTPSLLEELNQLIFKKRAYLIPLIYIVSAMSIGSTFYDLISESYKRNRKIILSPEDHEFWCPSYKKESCKSLNPMINEHYMIANVHNFILGLWFGVDFVLRKRYMLSFHIVEPRYLQTLHKELLTIWNRKKHGFIWETVVRALNFSIVFWIIKLIFWNFFFEWFPNIFIFQNTTNHYWLRAPWFDVQLFNRTIFCSIFIIMYWSAINLLFEHFFTRILSTIGVFMDPHAMLIDGLHAYNQPYYQQIAFLELWHISNFDPNRRSAMYADFNRKLPFNCEPHNNPTSAWAEISRICIDFILGLAQSAQDEIEGQQQRKIEMRRKHEQFKKLQASKQKIKVVKRQKNLEVKMTAETITKDREYWDMKLLEWFHPTGGYYPFFLRKIYYLVSVPLLKRSVERRTRNLFKDLYVTIYAIQALTALTVKSLHEDKHGIVQNDISNVFEVILDCLLSLEKYAQEPPLDDWDIGNPYALTSSKVLADPMIVVNVLKDSLFDLTETFMPHMNYVRLTSHHYERLDKLIHERI